MNEDTPDVVTSHAAFAEEVARVKESGVLGEGGRLAELFNFLAARGGGADAASQAEIAETVFGQAASESDDATVRVYIHRLRKRLDDYYAGNGEGLGDSGGGRLTIPAGAYALRFIPSAAELPGASAAALRGRWTQYLLPVMLVLLVVAAFFAGRFGDPDTAPVNPVWEPFLKSDRPIVVVVGDYYIYGDIDPMDPENGRLIRDFNINSKTDLARAQESNPKRYGMAEDMGLNYLPMSSSYGLAELMPILSQHGKKVTVMPASQVTSDTFRTNNIVYIGLMSGMGLLEDVNFMSSDFMVGESYDQLIDLKSNRKYTSQEALNLATPQYYHDYGYFSEFREPGGALVAVVAGARDTGLRGLAPIMSARALPDQLDQLAHVSGDHGFEVLFEITGQQGADLSEKLVEARKRP
ncbi:MAG: helix-turn-helix domain-containing protein [Candidatus Andeanibacterium colombiense]|uniref:Helix-turn-helix domain-containing protein n=1 Tax=Candidatus Andeanibacterium colombiense TaxID=3121345 RepID=A0AAJ5X5F0_9SPHN|nr:MAG: helix-turn-helix domain-containing protein [Sphingomonadaceae bacterium]